MVAKNVIVIVALRGCFMCVSVNELVHKLDVNSEIIEIEEVEKITILSFQTSQSRIAIDSSSY